MCGLNNINNNHIMYDVYMDNLSEFNNEDEYLDKVKQLKTNFFMALREYKKYFIFNKKNPEYLEYDTLLNNSRDKLNSVMENLHKIINDLTKNIDNYNIKLSNIYEKINILKTQNAVLKSKLKNIRSEALGSEEMIDDFEKLYNIQYINNLLFLLGLILSIIFSLKMFKSN